MDSCASRSRLAAESTALSRSTLHDAAPQPARGRRADATPDDIAVERMAEPSVHHRPVPDDPDQALHLGGVHGLLTGQFAQRLDVQRLTQRQQLQGVHHVACHVIEALLEQRRQAGRHHGAAAQLPHTVDLGQRSGIDSALDHVPQKQRVSARGLPHDVGTETLKGAAENGFDERDALLFRERRELETPQVAVLPQRIDGVGNGSPLRTVATIRPARSTAIWCSSVADSWSSRWASSTPMTVSGLARNGFARRCEQSDRVA